MTRLFWILLAIFMNTSNFYCQNERQINKADEALKTTISLKIPGASILVIKDNKVVFQKHYGYSNIKDSIKTSGETSYNLGTISKQFTAVAILKLINDNKLKFNTQLGEIFPSASSATKTITIKHLLYHESGLNDYTVTNEFRNENKNDIKYFIHYCLESDILKFVPGSRTEYNYSDYVILAGVIEKITKSSYAKFMEKKLFKPLKMKNTYISIIKPNSNSCAVPYNIDKDSNLIEISNNNNRNSYGNGNIYTSANDFYVWITALLSGKIINKELLDSVYTYGFTDFKNFNKRGYYNLGGFKYNVYGTNYLLEGGMSPGYSCSILRIPENNSFTIIMINRSTVYKLDKLTKEINNIFTGKFLYPGK